MASDRTLAASDQLFAAPTISTTGRVRSGRLQRPVSSRKAGFCPQRLLSKDKEPPRVNHIHKRVSQQPPKREVRYHCDYCHRDGHLAEFCFRRKRDEIHEYELYNRNIYCPPLGVHVLPVQRHSARPKGAMPQVARPLVVRPCCGRAWRGSGHDQYDFEPRDGAF